MTKVLLFAFVVMGFCVVIHVTGMVFLGGELLRLRDRIEKHVGFVYSAGLLMAIFSFVIILHVSEATIWAVFYDWAGLFPDFESSLYFSLASYSSLGNGDAVLPRNWRLLGTIEGISGVLLCGLSAAFLFAIVNALLQFRTRRLVEDRANGKES